MATLMEINIQKSMVCFKGMEQETKGMMMEYFSFKHIDFQDGF
jgi:hypothetical protein